LKIAIEIVDLPIEHGDFPSFFVCLPEGKSTFPLNLHKSPPDHQPTPMVASRDLLQNGPWTSSWSATANFLGFWEG